MDVDEFVRRHAASFGSQYEELFVRKVLAFVSEIPLERVRTQTPFTCHGTRRYADFTFEDEGLHLALEVDGYNKTGRSSGMTYSEFLDWMERQACLQAAGWSVLRFANGHVIHQPDRCRRNIELFLRNSRSNHLKSEAALSQGEALELVGLESERNKELSDLAARLAQAEAEAQNNLAQAARANAEVSRSKEEAGRWRMEAQEHEAKAVASAKDAETQKGHAAEYSQEIERALRDLDTVKNERDVIAEDRNKMSSRSVLALAILGGLALVAMAIVAYAAIAGGGGGAGGEAVAACDGAITPDEAYAVDLGEQVTVRGIVNARFADDSRTTFLNLAGDSREFTAVVFERSRKNFQDDPASAFDGREVCVTGELEVYEGKRQVVLSGPGQIHESGE